MYSEKPMGNEIIMLGGEELQAGVSKVDKRDRKPLGWAVLRGNRCCISNRGPSVASHV
jgi:hypothetical protein